MGPVVPVRHPPSSPDHQKTGEHEDTRCLVHQDEHHPVASQLGHLREDAIPALGRRIERLVGAVRS